MSVALAGTLTEAGYDGDPVNQRIKDTNTIIAALNAALTAIVASFGRGVATLDNGSTTEVVTHGLGFTPAPGDIVVCPIESMGAAVRFWVDTLTATQFTINVNADPTADVDFAWQAQQLDLT